MKRHIYKVVSVAVTGAYKLRLEFDDGSFQEVNLRPILYGEVFAPLRDLAMFDQVRIAPEIGTIVWPNGADMDPGILHDWPDYADDMAAMAARWNRKQSAETPQATGAALQVAEDKAEYGKKGSKCERKP